VTGRGLAPSVDTLDGKTVFLVDIGWENCDIFMQQMQGWFARHLPKVDTPAARAPQKPICGANQTTVAIDEARVLWTRGERLDDE
jgi:hypothetical protein